MKRALRHILSTLILAAALLAFTGCDYVLNERTFFKTMTNMLAFPSSYMGSDIELDCFVYELSDIETGGDYTLGVRKCSSGVGCTCGNDTIIGFILDYNGDIPAPRNQSEDTNDKAWIHIAGRLESETPETIAIAAYTNGVPNGQTEYIQMFRFDVASLAVIEDYSSLAYYVTD